MFKKILLILVFIIINLNITNAIDLPVNCLWLPWCEQNDPAIPSSWDSNEEKIFWTLWIIISEWVKYVAVIAVVALMLAGLNLVIGWWLSWEEEKVTNAKKWVLWAFVWVILSVSAWWIINILNNLQIDNF
jgi:hypothetical protein